MSYNRYIFAIALAALPLTAPAFGFASTLVPMPHPLVSEHADVNVTLSGSEWRVEPRDADAGGVIYPTGQAILHVDRLSQTARPAASTFDFIGATAGANYYRLPQGQNPSLLFLGVAGYGVSSPAIDRYNAGAESGGRVSGTGSWLKLLLDSVKGPGQFSVWQESFGGANVFISTAVSTPGNAGTDAIWLLANGHVHFNYGFTAPGLYEVNFRPSAFANDGNLATLGPVIQAAAPIPVYFNVDPGYATSGVVATSALPSVGTIAFAGGFREISLAPNSNRGAVRVGEIGTGGTGTAVVLLKLSDPAELGALTVALSGFDGSLYGLASVPATATLDPQALALYPAFDIALRFAGITSTTFDFQFDYSMILDGVGISRIGIVANTALVPEPTSLLSLLFPLVLLCRRTR